MTRNDFSTTATRCVEAFGTAAHGAVDACRTGGDRLAGAAAATWDRAFAQARPQLSAETRRNAAHARKVAARYWRRGVTASTDAADRAVDVIVDVAALAITRAEALRTAR
jgi:hypothetical protein